MMILMLIPEIDNCIGSVPQNQLKMRSGLVKENCVRGRENMCVRENTKWKLESYYQFAPTSQGI